MEEVAYCSDPGKVRVYPGVPAALRRLKEAAFLAFIVTNQSGIGRCWMSEEQYRAVQAELLRQIGEHSIVTSYFCPDRPGIPSARRKPAPGMLLEAAAKHDLDLPASYMIGDKASDVECGKRAGVKTILVMTGYGREQDCAPDYRAADAVRAVEIVLARRVR